MIDQFDSSVIQTMFEQTKSFDVLKGYNFLNNKTFILNYLNEIQIDINPSDDKELEQKLNKRREFFKCIERSLKNEADFLIQVALIDLDILIHDNDIKTVKPRYLIQALVGFIQQKPEVLSDPNLWVFFKRDFSIYFACAWVVNCLNQKNPNLNYHQFLNSVCKTNLPVFLCFSALLIVSGLSIGGVLGMPLPLAAILLSLSVAMIGLQVNYNYKGYKLASLYDYNDKAVIRQDYNFILDNAIKERLHKN